MIEATAIARANIAFAKYWGKSDGSRNLPAVPSISLTLDALETRTTVRFAEGEAGPDEVTMDGSAAPAAVRQRVSAFLDLLRRRAGRSGRAVVSTANTFPTGAGLASSASGFAAIALAASRAIGLSLDAAELSDLARRGSASAARSIFGGFVELPAASAGTDFLAASPLGATDFWDLAVVVAVADARKEIGSTEGMQRTEATSPYYAAWIETARTEAAAIRAAVLRRSFASLGESAERSALRMHAAAMAASPAVLYWAGATVEAIRAVRRMRDEGIETYFTIDAGPHVKALCRPEDAPEVARRLGLVAGIIRTIVARPGRGAELVEENRGRSSR